MKGIGNILFFVGLALFVVLVGFSFFGIDLQDWDWFNSNRWFITAICAAAMAAIVFGPLVYRKLKRRK